LLPVGARYGKAVEAEAREHGAQGGDAAGALRAVARVVESLEAGFEHGRTITVWAARATQLGVQNGNRPPTLTQDCATQYFCRNTGAVRLKD
jgi:hypothetical protein